MDVKELRIGNIIRTKGLKGWCDVQVEGILLNQIIYTDPVDTFADIIHTDKGTCYDSEIEGITLTEEWLLNLGFEKIGDVMNYDGFKLWWDDDDIRYYYHINSELLINFNYVHEVQNFWSAMLTGEELTITP